MLTTRLAQLSLFLVTLLTVTYSQSGPDWTPKPLTPDAAQAFLETTLHGEKNATITGVDREHRFQECEPGNIV
jgi:hypothetical protein